MEFWVENLIGGGTLRDCFMRLFALAMFRVGLVVIFGQWKLDECSKPRR